MSLNSISVAFGEEIFAYTYCPISKKEKIKEGCLTFYGSIIVYNGIGSY